ncbi:MAG: dipeptidyl carboxypeptidase II, partial [Sphingobacteriales bacterium]
MKRFPILFSIAMASIITSCNNKSGSTAAGDHVNPLLQASILPYQAPQFDKIQTADFEPALLQGMKEQKDEMQKIADNPDAPTFENTLIAMEKSGQLLTRVALTFNVLTGANTNEALQKVQESVAPKLAAHQDAIYLNDKLFKRVDAVFQQRASLNLDPESLRLVEYYHQQFELAGA